jgi:hypothetical protein
METLGWKIVVEKLDIIGCLGQSALDWGILHCIVPAFWFLRFLEASGARASLHGWSTFYFLLL